MVDRRALVVFGGLLLFIIGVMWWVVISVPKQPLAAGNFERVWHQDNATQEWLLYDLRPDLAPFNTLGEMTPGETYWVLVLTDQTMKFNGKEYKLYVGWNLVTFR